MPCMLPTETLIIIHACRLGADWLIFPELVILPMHINGRIIWDKRLLLSRIFID